MAYQSDHHFFHQQPPSLHGGHDQLMPLVMEDAFDRSTGYLEDAVPGWVNRFKRPRVLLFQNNESELGRFEDVIQEFWNWGSNGSQFEDWSYSSDLSKSINEGNIKHHVSSKEGGSLELDVISSISRLPDEPSQEAFANSNKLTPSFDCHSKMENGVEQRKRKKVVMGVVYPFTVVKPTDVDARVTLDDINKRILSRPTRPVRHPVGEFACLPRVTTIARPGLSGKVVVSLTRVHTQGRGTITIIRTRD